jgi:hypothetical protein
MGSIQSGIPQRSLKFTHFGRSRAERIFCQKKGG